MKVRFATFVLDSERRQLVRDGQPVHLSPKAFELLCHLAEKRPMAVAKTELYERIWPGTFVVDANLTVLVAELRRALGDDPQAPRYIRTLPKFGYAFCADVETGGTAPGPPGETRVGLTLDDRVMFLEEGENLIGRDPSCAIWLDRPGVSRVHARVLLRGPHATIDDLESKNGTFVNDVPVDRPRLLADLDAVHIGSVELRFRIWASGSAAETERIARRRTSGTA
jgi:DNA-binding winged helix-turn-helix (wHTH) protein